MSNIHLIATDKPSRLYQLKNDILRLDYKIDRGEANKNIYITSNEEIKEGDWFYVKTANIYGGNIIAKCLGFGENCWSEHILTDVTDERGYHPSHCVKIIITDNKDLIADGVQAINDEFLEWFVKNPSCEGIEVVEELNMNGKNGLDRARFIYKIIIPKEELINCPKCRTTDFKNCHSVRCPMRKEEPKTILERLPFPELVKEFAEYYKNVPLVKEKEEEPKQERVCNCGLKESEHNVRHPFIPRQETLEEAAEIDLTNLCYYDKRNPDCSVDDEDIEDHKKSLLKKNKTCSCDNCFYGRTKLTEQLIWQQKRMYSEEEVEEKTLLAMISIMQEYSIINESSVVQFHKEWFEQFKKS